MHKVDINSIYKIYLSTFYLQNAQESESDVRTTFVNVFESYAATSSTYLVLPPLVVRVV